MNKRTQKSRATSNNSNLNFNADIPCWSKASSSEEEDIGKTGSMKRSRVDIINEEVKLSSIEGKEIGIRKCRRRSRVDIINEEVKEWTSPPKQKGYPPEPTNTKK